jgi:hypothetical protein
LSSADLSNFHVRSERLSAFTHSSADYNGDSIDTGELAPFHEPSKIPRQEYPMKTMLLSVAALVLALTIQTSLQAAPEAGSVAPPEAERRGGGFHGGMHHADGQHGGGRMYHGRMNSGRKGSGRLDRDRGGKFNGLNNLFSRLFPDSDE